LTIGYPAGKEFRLSNPGHLSLLGGGDPRDLISVVDARDRVLRAFAPTSVVSLPLLDALGLVLAEDVIATRDVPPFPNSAMDGFACHALDIASATKNTPVHLEIAQTISAGDEPTATLEPGSAARIMTGAPIPFGADVVVAFERSVVSDDGSGVRIRHAYESGTNMRFAGEDMRAGDIVLRAGKKIRPAEIALLAAIGRTHVDVHRRPVVAILATGDEVVAPGETPSAGQIWDANSDAIAAMVQQAGGVSVRLGIAKDNAHEIRSRLTSETNIDLILTSGGVSAGDFDLIQEILHEDAKMEFWQVRIKPGRPLAFGSFGGTPLLGLPGNPIAVAVTFLQFARPAIRTMLGETDLTVPTVQARMMNEVENGGRREHYIRVRLTRGAEGFEARLAGSQGAAILTALSNADGLLVIPETMEYVEPGTVLTVELLD